MYRPNYPIQAVIEEYSNDPKKGKLQGLVFVQPDNEDMILPIEQNFYSPISKI